MDQLTEYRQKLLDRLPQAAREFCAACLAVKDPSAPLAPGEWNVHQLAAHTRDVDKLVYGERARRTLQEDNPQFMNFDGDAYMAEHYDPREPLQTLLDGFQASVMALTKQLHEMPVSGWSRPSRHETQGGGITLQTWVERALAHIEEHLETVKKLRRLP